MAVLYYGDDVIGGEYAVEIGDHVEVRIDGHVHDGQVAKLHPKSHEVTVRYLDELNTTRAGEPRRKTARVHVLTVDLIRRDG